MVMLPTFPDHCAKRLNKLPRLSGYETFAQPALDLELDSPWACSEVWASAPCCCAQLGLCPRGSELEGPLEVTSFPQAAHEERATAPSLSRASETTLLASWKLLSGKLLSPLS